MLSGLITEDGFCPAAPVPVPVAHGGLDDNPGRRAGAAARMSTQDIFRAARPFACAEYACWPQDGVLAARPAGLRYEEAAAIPYGGPLALPYPRRANVRGGQRVLIYGASGAVGTCAVQLARHFGADVTGVCSGANLDLVRSLGAATVVDHTSDEVTGRPERTPASSG